MNQLATSLIQLEAYLNSSRFIDNFLFNDKHKAIINAPLVVFIGDPIAKNEKLSPSLKKTLAGLQALLGNNTITFNMLYTEYIQIISQFSFNYHPYSFPDFVNGLSIFELVFTGFNQELLKISIQMTSEEVISVHFINEPESDSFSIYQSLISKQPSDSPSLMINNLLFIFNIFSLCGKFSYGKPNPSAFITNLDVYNKFYISHLNYGLLAHIGVMVYSKLVLLQAQALSERSYDSTAITMGNVPIHSKHWIKWSSTTCQIESKARSRSRINVERGESKHFTQGSSKSLANNVIDEEINLTLIDTASEVQLRDCVKVSLCLNSLKMLLFESLPNLFDFKLNVTIISPKEITRTSFAKNFESTYYSKAIQAGSVCVTSKVLLSKLFKQWPINLLIIKLPLSNQLDSINKLFAVYSALITKALEIHIKDITHESEDYISLDTLLLEFSILEIILSKMTSTKEHSDSKKAQCSYSFIFNFWKMIINRSSSSKDISLYYNYSNLQEKVLFNYLVTHINLLNFIRSLIKAISLMEAFLGYNSINIRLFQNSFRSKQLEFSLQVIVNAVVNYVIDKHLDNVINVNERAFNYFIPSMHCYLNDANTNRKHKLSALKQTFNKTASMNRHFKFLSFYLAELSELFSIVIFSESASSFKLIRTYDDRKIMFILSKKEEQPKASAFTLNAFQTEAYPVPAEYTMHVYVYLHNDKDGYLRTLPLLHSIRVDKFKKCGIDITLICDKNYLETSVLVEHKSKKLICSLSEDINNLYVISKTPASSLRMNKVNPEYFNYDIYLSSERVTLMTYAKYDFSNDVKCQQFLFSFISIVSNCIEMILYLLKNKDIIISRFIFVYKNCSDSTFLLNFKEGNVFLKKSYETDNLTKLNAKTAVPVFCLLSKKKTSSHTISNENFFDVFPRLFLNLHKVSHENVNSFNDVLLRKIHKNIFSDYYDRFFPIIFSYEAFKRFNAFFLSNDYLAISKGDKFAKGYLFPFDPLSAKEGSFEEIIVKEVFLFNLNIKMSGKDGEENYKYFTLSKLNSLIKALKVFTEEKRRENRKILSYLHRKFSNGKALVIRIAAYLWHERVRECFIEQRVIEEKIEEFQKDKANRENDRVENRINQLTEAAKYEHTINKDKSCYLI